MGTSVREATSSPEFIASGAAAGGPQESNEGLVESLVVGVLKKLWVNCPKLLAEPGRTSYDDGVTLGG